MVRFTAGQDAHCLERAGHVAAQMLLAVPRRTVNRCALAGDVDQGLVSIHHHGTRAKLFEPEPGVGGFACAAFGGEQVRLPIHGNHCTVHQKHIFLHQHLRQLAVDRQRFQIAALIFLYGSAFL